MKKLELELRNIRVNFRGGKKITVGGGQYLQNPQEDVWEILEGDCKGEQFFTWDAAMRETKEVGKIIPTDDEFSKILKTKADMPNLILAGYRDTDGTFYGRGTYAYFWSSTESGATAWYRDLDSANATVYRHTYGKANGFSVRCLKN
ncbi:fibrobacter succinogenes major paralogous domain-containing protein [Patescibacteria group bacterium]|nr:fibrobacter succinogenes major paralogous domain-containing protein [Patescibacteria group bacterium]